jgi:cation:H+ antiporter
VKPFLLGLLTGHGPLIPFLALGLAGALVFLLAARLARQADVIAEATGLGRVWIGSVLLAASTSLPEVFTDVNAARLDVPDIGVGDLFGSTLANMLILAALDLVFARRRILHQVAAEHTLVALLGILLTLMAGIGIFVGGWGRIGHVGVETLAIALAYLAGMWLLYRAAQGRPVPGAAPGDVDRAHLRRAAAGFGLGAAGVAVVTPFLVLSAEAVSRETGMSATFVGTLLVGLTTSFPEMAATASAVRLGALDLAVGNVFGSNAFNMTVLLIMDLAYLRGPVLAAVSREHVLTVLLAATCLALGTMAILSRAQRHPGRVTPESALIVVTYAVGAWLLAGPRQP